MSTKLKEGMIDSLNCCHLCFFVVLRSGVDEHFAEKEQFLTEAAALFDEAGRKKKAEVEQKSANSNAEAQKREIATKTRDDALKTLSQKRLRDGRL